MPVQMLVRMSEATTGGTDITFHAKPDGKMSAQEIEIANVLVCICNLLSNEEFLEHIGGWVDAELKKLHAEEKNEAIKGSKLVM